MQVVDANGGQLTELIFISAYRMALKTAPARFWTLRIHPNLHVALVDIADVPESIQMGPVPSRMPGKKPDTKICCVSPPNGVNDGITIIQDEKCELNQLSFEMHGIPEVVVVNLR